MSLSEPQLFQCDASQVLQLLDSEYNYFLNSDDLHDPELGLSWKDPVRAIIPVDLSWPSPGPGASHLALLLVLRPRHTT